MCIKNDIDLHSLHTVSISEVNNTIIGKWSESVNDEDKQVGMHVLELCIERDSLNERVFARGGGGSLILLLFYVSYIQHVFMYIILLNYLNVLAISRDVIDMEWIDSP